MPLQRRYSVTGQTPPDPADHVGGMKSPKLQTLDTSVQSTSCGLCEGSMDSGKSSGLSTLTLGPRRSEEQSKQAGEMAHITIARTSSKRSATQLPSPNTPSSHELPPKIARLGLDHEDMDLAVSDTDVDDDEDDEGSFSDPLPDSDWPSFSHDSPSTSTPSSPTSDPTIYSDACECIEETGLSPLPVLDPEVFALSPQDLGISPLSPSSPLPPTLLTLPPELRHQIYLHLPDLVLPYPLIYCLSTFADKKQHPLASVSRQIRSEAQAIFYSYNTWILKLEFKIMYDVFQSWIVGLGDGAAHLRIVHIAVRGSLFKPRTSHPPSLGPNGHLMALAGNNALPAPVEEYCPPDGDASFKIDLSEKYNGGKVELLRNDGTREAGEKAKAFLEKLVEGLWEKRRVGMLNGQDWVDMVDRFLSFAGWW
ncbi:hypothetical protein CC78DRAFT_529736 [Lojkania enalia]|uniref:F-box domain-containing protein n=1 Tax=Lojkania enalia TaxID=147567 RepID=A0A9P4KJS1_9PLEO|nr:hypothetical protein CC78DRAFT_529736 [Didymosphaeria enalia]